MKVSNIENRTKCRYQYKNYIVETWYRTITTVNFVYISKKFQNKIWGVLSTFIIRARGFVPEGFCLGGFVLEGFCPYTITNTRSGDPTSPRFWMFFAFKKIARPN